MAEANKQIVMMNREEDSTFDLKLLFTIFSKWPLFVVSVVCFMTLAELYYRSRTPMFETSASVIVEQTRNAPEEQMLLQGMGFTNTLRNNIDNEIGVLSSPNLVGKLVRDMHLYADYRWDDNVITYRQNLYKDTPIMVMFVGEDMGRMPSAELHITCSGSGVYNVEAQYRKEKRKIVEAHRLALLPARITIDGAQFEVSRNDSIPFDGQRLMVRLTNPDIVTAHYVKSLNITTSAQFSTQLNISLRVDNRFLGADLLRNLINEYNIDAIADKNATAHATALFIEERLKDITQELNEVEEQAENYRKANSFTDLTTQGGVYLNQREGYDRTLTELETQLNLLRFIDRYLADNARRLIPAVKILNSGLHEMIGDYNKLVVEYNRVESGASAENPVASQLKKQLETYRNNILASVKTEIKTTRIQIGDLKKELASTDDKIRRIPTIDREYTDIMRQREVKATLFSFLLQKREEINLTQAGVVPKARTIASPYSSGQVSPRKSMVFIMFFMLAMLVPSAALYLTYLLRTRIRDISDLDALHGPTVVGDIARAVEGDFCDPASCMVVASDCDSVITEMFRTMRNNLLFMLGSCERNHDRGNGCNVVLVTSTIPKEGKTFISINLARMLSLMDKKVLLIGADLRNPQLAYALNIVKSERGLSSWLAGMVASVDELLVEYAPNMSILQAGPIPPNPNELLSGPRMRELFDMLHGRFDYVVVDSAPVGVVSDTFVISQYADAVVYVMRENYTQKDAIPFVNNLVSDGRLHGVAVALNATGVSGKMSRYKYGATRYGYKSSYRYRYEYVGAGSGGKGGRKKR